MINNQKIHFEKPKINLEIKIAKQNFKKVKKRAHLKNKSKDKKREFINAKLLDCYS